MNKNFFYICWLPDDFGDLNWFEVFATRTEANEHGRELAKEYNRTFRYVAHGSAQHVEHGSLHPKQGTSIIVTQSTSLYHGA